MLKAPANQVRIIGGKWRGRKIFFPNQDSLRPTPNRIRETLFNWLSPVIRGSVCLDMFAGSGSLSFEALSRGANHAILWETNQKAFLSLHENAKRLEASHIEIHPVRFTKDLPTPDKYPRFDIIFLDPPFHQNYIETACQWLQQAQCLKPSSLIYIEAECTLNPLPLPLGWNILKSQKAGNVCYYLVDISENTRVVFSEK